MSKVNVLQNQSSVIKISFAWFLILCWLCVESWSRTDQMGKASPSNMERLHVKPNDGNGLDWSQIPFPGEDCTMERKHLGFLGGPVVKNPPASAGDMVKIVLWKGNIWASLVVQWLRIHLPVQGKWVRSLVQEDPTF